MDTGFAALDTTVTTVMTRCSAFWSFWFRWLCMEPLRTLHDLTFVYRRAAGRVVPGLPLALSPDRQPKCLSGANPPDVAATACQPGSHRAGFESVLARLGIDVASNEQPQGLAQQVSNSPVVLLDKLLLGETSASQHGCQGAGHSKSLEPQQWDSFPAARAGFGQAEQQLGSTALSASLVAVSRPETALGVGLPPVMSAQSAVSSCAVMSEPMEHDILVQLGLGDADASSLGGAELAHVLTTGTDDAAQSERGGLLSSSFNVLEHLERQAEAAERQQHDSPTAENESDLIKSLGIGRQAEGETAESLDSTTTQQQFILPPITARSAETAEAAPARSAAQTPKLDAQIGEEIAESAGGLPDGAIALTQDS